MLVFTKYEGQQAASPTLYPNRHAGYCQTVTWAFAEWSTHNADSRFSSALVHYSFRMGEVGRIEKVTRQTDPSDRSCCTKPRDMLGFSGRAASTRKRPGWQQWQARVRATTTTSSNLVQLPEWSKLLRTQD